ncbi:glutathione S-transferase [Purpureocillium lavendulum]|uniref:Glutathione S-transferase n=1 Tax=Purpureocillium lavendulum TaxID=1247861 RepID=A0AB34FV35_9HYPO|nr:glutathione S-transferase [Purpureocillium lavendulum]
MTHTRMERLLIAGLALAAISSTSHHYVAADDFDHGHDQGNDERLNLCCRPDDVELTTFSDSRFQSTRFCGPYRHRASTSVSSCSSSSSSSSSSFSSTYSTTDTPPRLSTSSSSSSPPSSPYRTRTPSFRTVRPPPRRQKKPKQRQQELHQQSQKELQQHQLADQDKIKRGIWAAAFAAVIFVGSLTGAQLKSDKQKEETIKQFRQTTAADQIAVLEAQKVHLLQNKAQLQRKLDVFKERVREREAEKGAKGK